MTLAERPAADPLLLVTVGSDHHPFGRLIRWIDDYLDDRHPTPPLRYVCQYGTAPAPRSSVEAHAYIDHADLQALMQRASAIVVQGGPYSMIESLRNGRVPIAVPRQRDLREHVDDHQLAFCRFLAERNEILLATTEEEFYAAMDKVLHDPDAFTAPPAVYAEQRAAAVQRFGSAINTFRPLRRPGVRRRRPTQGQKGS
jgi:UDP-N-acetylglucosamine transferase subunit ALG13